MHDLNTAIVFQVTAILLKVKERIFGGMIGKSCYAHLAWSDLLSHSGLEAMTRGRIHEEFYLTTRSTPKSH